MQHAVFSQCDFLNHKYILYTGLGLFAAFFFCLFFFPSLCNMLISNCLRSLYQNQEKVPYRLNDVMICSLTSMTGLSGLIEVLIADIHLNCLRLIATVLL